MRRRLLLEQSSLKFNQIFNTTAYRTYSGDGITASPNGTKQNVYGTPLSTSYTYFVSKINWRVANHKYLICGFSFPEDQGLRQNGFRFAVNNRNYYKKEPFIFTSTADSTGDAIYLYYTEAIALDFQVELMEIDLTEMYGVGNEPTTVEQVKADCLAIGHNLDEYQPYTPIA